MWSGDVIGVGVEAFQVGRKRLGLLGVAEIVKDHDGLGPGSLRCIGLLQVAQRTSEAAENSCLPVPIDAPMSVNGSDGVLVL